jgi:DNA-binding MarR family transcriptional regulator
MPSTVRENETGDDRILLGLLETVERDGGQSQRRIASELGIALGLVNAYLKRCVRKGLVKVSEAPARRYAYYLTPKGFAEKSRLTFEFLSSSFSLFRRARADCAEVFVAAHTKGMKRIVVVGLSELAEVARLCALESGVEIVALVDPSTETRHYFGLPVVNTLADVSVSFDAVIVTQLRSVRECFDSLAAEIGAHRVLVPKLLGIRVDGIGGEQR